jgi:hypothetical protein
LPQNTVTQALAALKAGACLSDFEMYVRLAIFPEDPSLICIKNLCREIASFLYDFLQIFWVGCRFLKFKQFLKLLRQPSLPLHSVPSEVCPYLVGCFISV